jgi:hypothetical protein
MRSVLCAWLIAVLAVLACAAHSPARADIAVSWAASERSYGWCESGDVADAERCAADHCRNAGGSDCQTLVTCANGYTAMAKPEKPATGLAVACGMQSPDWARIMALAACVSAANAICWTDTTTEPDGTEIDVSRNRPFDRAFYASLLLQGRGYRIDGASGDATPELAQAIAAFQRDMARPETGATDPPLLFDLIAASGGRTVVADAIRDGVLDRHGKGLERQIVAQMTATLPRQGFTEEIATWSPEDQAAAMAAVVRSTGGACRDPIASASLPPGVPDTFTLVCADEEHVVVMQPNGGRTLSSAPVARATDPAGTP